MPDNGDGKTKSVNSSINGNVPRPGLANTSSDQVQRINNPQAPNGQMPVGNVPGKPGGQQPNILPSPPGRSTGPGTSTMNSAMVQSNVTVSGGIDPSPEVPETRIDDEKEEKKESFSIRKFKDSIVNLIKGRPKEAIVTKQAKKTNGNGSSFGKDMELMETIDLTNYIDVEIYLDVKTNEYFYHPIEPKLGPKQKEVLDFIMDTLNKALSYNKDTKADFEEKKKFLNNEVESILNDYSSKIGEISQAFIDPIQYYIRREFLGYGKINSIMMDPGVEDVSCDGTGIPVFVYHRDFGSIRTTIQFDTDEELEGFVVSLAQRAGKTISVAHPILDATLPEGHRLNATFGREVTTRGSSFTIRKFKEDPLTITDLVKFGTMSSEMAAHFWMTVQYGESIIFAGGTASGKTATMNAVSIFIPTSAKIISIEDTREVNLPHQNWIAGITRGSAEGTKDTDIDMYQLLRAALRQRPEYVLVGEVRGKETMTMFQAMATGHTTYSTMHADSVKSIVYRLENPPISIPRVLITALNLVAIHNQIRVKGMRVRRITELVEIVGIEPTSLEIITNRVYKWEAAGDHFVFGGHSNLYEKVMDFDDMTRDEVITELNRRAEIIDWMLRNEVRKFRDVSTIVAEYYEDPEKVVGILRQNPDIEIKKGLDIFDKARKEMLPPSDVKSLPSVPKGVEEKEKAQTNGGV
jgi:flagellar protein FlaI